jgi:hypothetical protein
MTERDDAADALVQAVRDTLAELEHTEPDTPTEINLLRKLHALVAEWERAAGDKAE